MKKGNSVCRLLNKLLYLVFISMALWSCEGEEPELQVRGIRLHFDHHLNTNKLVFNSMQYINAAGNPYEVKEIMYFISDVKLYHSNGNLISKGSLNDIHYTDTNLPETWEWLITGDYPTGTYDSLSFTFGIKSSKNQSFMFVNPPEVNMAWPEVLGGGYHYLMLNGWWRDTVDLRRPFDFHLGIGQIYENNSGQVPDIIEFVDNSFSVKVSGAPFRLEDAKVTDLRLVMNVERWFNTPVIYDHNIWGGAIMQKQEAMHLGCLNGWDVFTLEPY
ncbi:MAG: hypothetical protein RBR28_04660 [Lentimicrobium sp.]|nr:hypothetical protein [Lentimicrobium sp.]